MFCNIALLFYVGCCTVLSSSTDSSEEIFKGTSGTIYSPYYPEHYHNNEYKEYKIIAPSLSKIVLTFNDFDVEYNYDCGFDSLKASNFTLIVVFSTQLITAAANSRSAAVSSVHKNNLCKKCNGWL